MNPLTLPTPGSDSNVWGPINNTALTALKNAIDTLEATVATLSGTVAAASTAASTAQSTATAAQTTANAAAVATNVYTKAAADLKYVQTVNGSGPTAGNVTVSPEPGVQAIYYGVPTPSAWALRTTKSSDPTQPVLWVGPAATPPPITAGYAVDGVDLWAVSP